MGAQSPNMYRFLLLAAALCAAASAFPAEQPMDMDMGVTGLWNAFKIDFNEVYSPEEEAHRLVAFKDNVETIYRHKAEQAPTQGWTMGINEYSDMSSEEFSAMQGFRAEDNPQGELVHLNETDVPATVDWTTKGAVNPIKNQGQCGSCWAFGTVASVEGINAIKNKKLVSLSEQQLVNCGVDWPYNREQLPLYFWGDLRLVVKDAARRQGKDVQQEQAHGRPPEDHRLQRRQGGDTARRGRRTTACRCWD